VAKENQTVVVLDDDHDLLSVIQEALVGEGFKVIALSHPDQTLELQARDDLDLFLVDMMLPGKNGLRIGEYLRTVFPNHAMVAMSGDRLSLLFAARSGIFNGTLAKPFDIDMLVETCRQFAGLYVTRPMPASPSPLQ